MDNLILSEVKQNVLFITLNRFDKKNALTTSMYQELCRLFEQASNNPLIHCVLIQGNQTCFCAGNDLADFLAIEQDEEFVAFQFVQCLAEFNKPLIAAVAGPAVGIGTTLLLHCDMVFTADNTKFKLPFAQLGLCPEAGSSTLLPLRIGHNKAFELLVLGETFMPEQALALGIVNQICSPDELLPLAEQTALAIAKLPHEAVMASRKLIKNATQSVHQALKDEKAAFSHLLQTNDCKTILSSFFKK
ncbi:enoyl-CoA hydratase-related protein [Thalassotalea fusca]